LNSTFSHVCRYGINAGVIEPPEDCQLRDGTCDVILVQSSNTEKLCGDETGSASKAIQLFRKKKIQIKRIFSKTIN